MTSSTSRVLVVGVAVAAAAVAAAVAATSLAKNTKNKRVTEKATLSELTEQLHGVLVEMAQMATRVRQVLAMKGMTKEISDEEIAEIILNQGIAAKLDEVQQRVLSKHGLSEQDILGFAEIASFNADFQEMFAAAAGGFIPVLPNFEIPAALGNVDKMVEMMLRMGRRKLELFRTVLKEFPIRAAEPTAVFSDPTVSAALQKANDQAEAECLALVGVERSAFFSSLGIFSRDKLFEEERRKIDRGHQVDVMKLVSASAEVEAVEAVTGMDERMKKVTQDTLPLVLMDGADRNLCVVVALLKPEIAGEEQKRAVLKAINDKIPEIADQLKEKTPLFAYMSATQDSPLVQHEKCADKDVVYVVFAGTDVVRRPVACLSNDELLFALADLVPARSGRGDSL